MAKRVAIGIQDFETIIRTKCFYVDKTSFIKEWWESQDSVTLIARPRRFGKTLNMSMLECFFSVDYADRGDLFEGLSVWEDDKYRNLQGSYPVISLSFANVKEQDYEAAREKICGMIADLYNKYSYLPNSTLLTESDKVYINETIVKKERMSDAFAGMTLNRLSQYLYKHYGKKVIILLDEYDTPMQEAYVGGYWEEMVAFTRTLFNSTFKTNPYLERAVMTGITRVSKESVFSDLNNLEVVTTTSNKYESAFGFTQEETFSALDECGFGDKKEQVKQWYDGFVFGDCCDIYNPWSILNFLDKGKVDTYWANTSSNSLVGKLIREGDRKLKADFETLLKGETISCPLDEQIVYNQLDDDSDAIWSLLLASGYLKAIGYEQVECIDKDEEPLYELAVTNHEVRRMFRSMVRGWFGRTKGDYSDFVKSLLEGNLDAMNEYMNRVAQQVFSSFDTGKKMKHADAYSGSRARCALRTPSSEAAWQEPSGSQPERFYHGFVLGLIVELSGKYVITSNRESGFGRYDVMIEPKDRKEDAIILEFKVFNPKKESSLEETVQSALTQIEEKQYEADLEARGFDKGQIRKYGFAFEGKTVLIG